MNGAWDMLHDSSVVGVVVFLLGIYVMPPQKTPSRSSLQDSGPRRVRCPMALDRAVIKIVCGEQEVVVVSTLSTYQECRTFQSGI